MWGQLLLSQHHLTSRTALSSPTSIYTGAHAISIIIYLRDAIRRTHSIYYRAFPPARPFHEDSCLGQLVSEKLGYRSKISN